MSQEVLAPALFISYCHKDESYLKEFVAHLAPLQRDKTISHWYDRRLVAGDVLDAELRTFLEGADLVAFLVSADFLSSISCYEDELMNTLSRRDASSVRILPVIVRECLWLKTPLGKFVATTRDGKAVVSYSDRDTAWVEVAHQIESAATEWRETVGKKRSEIEGKPQEIRLLQVFSNWLDSTEVVYRHRYKDPVLLSDVFIFPHLRAPKTDEKDIEETMDSSALSDPESVGDGVLIFGDEQSGKTSLAKVLFRTYYDSGCLPLLVQSKAVSSSDPKRAFGKSLDQQYTNTTWINYTESERRRVLILEDLHHLRLNSKSQQNLLNAARELFFSIVLTADSTLMFDERRMAELAAFRQWEMLSLGNVKRGELIERWVSLGREETITDELRYQQVDQLTRHIDSVLVKNIVPFKPLYVLTIMQILDSTSPADFSLTSYGYCYQVLIQQALQKVGVRSRDLDRYVNYLSELAYCMFSIGGGRLDLRQFESFKHRYSESFVLRSHDEILETLHSAGVLSSDDGYLWFTYRYIYYFYIGKHLADHLDEALQGDIERICEKMYTEENANVLIFLIHHTRDQRVIDEVLLRGYVTFDSVDPARLDRDETRHILEFLETVPELAIEYRNIEVERRRRLETKDAVDRELGNIESEEVDEIAELDETIADIARSIRMIDVVGQILRNRSGSLLRPQATDLARAGFESGLKFLSFWLDLTRTDQEILIGLISDALKEDGSVSDENVGRAAGRTYLMLTYGVCIGVIRRIASALASEDLLDVFDSLEKEDSGSIAVQLINVAMRLDISKSIPKRKIETVNAKLDNNPMARRVLKHLLVEHVYLHDVPVRDKQWISDKLGLPMKTQRLVDARSKRKRSGPTNP